jgi:hypothetical protein
MPIVSKKAACTLEEPTHPPRLVVELVAGRLYPTCHQNTPLVRGQTVVGVPQVAVVASVQPQGELVADLAAHVKSVASVDCSGGGSSSSHIHHQ